MVFTNSQIGDPNMVTVLSKSAVVSQPNHFLKIAATVCSPSSMKVIIFKGI
jgi:hypothetical protein